MHRRHRRVEVPQRYQRARQRSETPLQRQTESSSSATPAAKRAESRAGHERPSGAPKAPRCLPAGHPNTPTTLNAETIGGSRRMPLDGHVGGRHGRGAESRAGQGDASANNGYGLSLTQRLRRRGQHGPPGLLPGPSTVVALPVPPWQCARSGRHAVTAAAVGVATTLVVATPGRRRRC